VDQDLSLRHRSIYKQFLGIPLRSTVCRNLGSQNYRLHIDGLLSPCLSQQPVPNTVERPTNKDILHMVRAQASAETIIEKIKRSRCNFDTDPTQLAELRSKGVPAEVLQAMRDAPFGLPSTPPSSSYNTVPTKLGHPQASAQDPNSIAVAVP
jgi:hypothetical protein